MTGPANRRQRRLHKALDAMVRTEQAKDRAYWAPLKAELHAFRRAEREGA